MLVSKVYSLTLLCRAIHDAEANMHVTENKNQA